MKRLLISLFIVLFSVSTANAFFELKKAKKAIGVGEYDTAITLLKKIVHKGDPEANYQLGVAYLMHKKYDSEAEQKFRIVAKNNPEFKDRIVIIYLDKINVNQSRFQIDYYLRQAEQYVSSESSKRRVADLLLRSNVKNNKKRAARLIGHKEVYGFTITRLSNDTFKVSFFTDKPVNVIEWKKGMTITFVEISDPVNVKRYYPNKKKKKKILLDYPLTASANRPLMIQGKTGEFLVIQSKTYLLRNTNKKPTLQGGV